MEGLVLFNKPKGVTSAEVVRWFKEKFKTKVGHGGTLDPLAEGLLILGLGRQYTKKLGNFLQGSEKEYQATIQLGATSTTDDAEGEISPQSTPLPSLPQIKTALKHFEGHIKQRPPAFSAIKVGGRPAYQLARQGKKIGLQPRTVWIKKIILEKYHPPLLKLKVITASGVYLRSLARDLGEALGCGAYLAALCRTRINQHILTEAFSWEEIEKGPLAVTGVLRGRVQGVSFRHFIRRWGQNYHLSIHPRNLANGCLIFRAQGNPSQLEKLIEKIKQGPPRAQVEEVELLWHKAAPS